MPDDGLLKFSIRETLDTKKIQELLSLSAVKILVGFPSGRTHIEARHDINQHGQRRGGSDVSDGPQMTTAELAEALHYGSALIPARPFLEEGLESEKGKLANAIKEQVQKIKEGQNPNWDKVGTMAVGAIQEFVRSDFYKNVVPNSEQTIKNKGSDTPLIDGGDLIGSMSYIVEGNK